MPKYTRIRPSITLVRLGSEEARPYLDNNPPDVVYVPITPDEARALMRAVDNSLTDDDFRRDHMTAAERRLADHLAKTLDLIGCQVAAVDERASERREDDRRKVARRQKVDETSPLRRTPEIRRTKPGKRYYTRRT